MTGSAAPLSVAQPIVLATVPDDLSTVAAVPTRPAPRRRVAVFAVHGMGQQVPFETLHAVAQTVVEQHVAAGGTIEDYVARQVSVRDHWMPRVEVTLVSPKAGEQHDVHFYESYWAPLTEGQVHWWDVIQFLFGAALRGLWMSRDGFERWMFGRFVNCRLATWGRWQLAMAALVVAILPLVGVTAVAYPVLALAAAFMTDAERVWQLPVVGRVGLATLLMTSVLTTIVGVGAFSSTLPYWFKKRWRGGTKRSLFALTLGSAGLAAAGVEGTIWAAEAFPTAGGRLDVAPWAHWLMALAGVVVVLVGGRVIVQYVGDVAAYVSAHAVSRFAEIRTAIQRAGRDVAHAVYGAQGATRDEQLYSEVVVLGHSLGSVVAYDVLNESIRRDWALASRGLGSLDVVKRTSRFITFGSPLDKTAFFFRTQKDGLLVREVLAASVQPIIVSPELWPGRWVNIWTPWDWISGRLDYYDDPAGRGAVVENHVDEESPVWPWLAHNGYWRRSRFRGALYDAVR